MTWRLLHYWGHEIDWLATDRDGFVAMLSSAGHGPFPEMVAALRKDMRTMEDRVLALDPIGRATSPDGATEDVDCNEAAERGFFVFDFDFAREGNRYWLEAVPTRPLRIEEIADEVVRKAAELVRIDVRFSQLRWISWNEAGELSSGVD